MAASISATLLMFENYTVNESESIFGNKTGDLQSRPNRVLTFLADAVSRAVESAGWLNWVRQRAARC